MGDRHAEEGRFTHVDAGLPLWLRPSVVARVLAGQRDEGMWA